MRAPAPSASLPHQARAHRHASVPAMAAPCTSVGPRCFLRALCHRRGLYSHCGPFCSHGLLISAPLPAVYFLIIASLQVPREICPWSRLSLTVSNWPAHGLAWLSLARCPPRSNQL